MKKIFPLLILALCLGLSAKDKAVDYSKIESWTNLEKYLVNSKGRKASKLDLKSKDYFLVYYSASWCPPCRKFTPKLVDYYNKHAKSDNFELIFVSSDRSDDASEKYMQDYKMPWPAVKLNKMKYVDLKKYAGRGIPSLVLFNKKGEILAQSYVDGKYMGPSVALNKLDQLRK